MTPRAASNEPGVHRPGLATGQRMKVLHLKSPDDGEVVRGVARLQRLQFLLEPAPPLAQRFSFPPVDQTVEPPLFAEMMAIVEQPGRRRPAQRDHQDGSHG